MPTSRPAQFVLDGSPLTRWESLPGDKKPWVEIDLGEEREVKECKIRWFRAWKKPPAKWRVSPALPARTRYVLIEIDDISPNKLASIEEVEIQSAAPGIDKSSSDVLPYHSSSLGDQRR